MRDLKGGAIMHKVICPKCSTIREVSAHKPWMTGFEPFEKLCKSCSMKGKIKSAEHCEKLSLSLKAIQSPELLEKKSQYMKAHPEHWQGKLKEGGAEEHSLGKKHSQEVKDKISKGVKLAKNKESK